MSQAFNRSWIAGKYELLEPIGEGGMATVWRGLTHGAGGFARKVAIKRVLPKLDANPEYVAMFVEEARVVSELQHPNVVQIHDFDRDDEGSLFLVMEWVEGLDMARWLRAYRQSGTRAPWPLVAAVGVEVLRALAAAHERLDSAGHPSPIIHRDVSPSNILIGSHGVVKLADFGLARARDRASMTKPGTIKGKLAYMAPEMLHGERASGRSDIYGLGIVLWEALTGERLFQGTTDIDTVMLVRAGRVPPLRDKRPDLPLPFTEIIHAALAVDPQERFATAREMDRAISSILKSHPEPTDAEPLGRSVRDAILLIEPQRKLPERGPAATTIPAKNKKP